MIRLFYLGTSGSESDSSVNQLASWIIENPCIDAEIDDNGNRTNLLTSSGESINSSSMFNEMDLSSLNLHLNVSCIISFTIRKRTS